MFSWRRTTGSSPTGQGDRVHAFHHLLDCARRGDSEAFLKMVEGIGRLRAEDEAGFAAWLFQIARITVAGYFRKREKQPTFIPLIEPAYHEEEKESGEFLADHPDSDPVFSAEVR